VRLTPLEWTLLLGEICPTLHRDREALATICETGGGAGTGTAWNAAAQLKRQRTVSYTPYGGLEKMGGNVGPGKLSSPKP
jgi:hypothetical protein